MKAKQILPNLKHTFNNRKQKESCLHNKTIALNEEGHAGIFCIDCGERIKNEC